MRKFLLSMAVLALGASSALAADEPIYTLQFGSDYNQSSVNNYTSDWSVKCNGTEWSISKYNNNNSQWAFVRAGSKSGQTKATVVNAAPWSDKINQIVITARKNKSGTDDKTTSAKVEVLSSLEDGAVATASYDITDAVNALTTNATATDIEVNIAEPVANMYYRIVLDNPKNTNNGWFELHTVKYYGESDLLSPAIEFPQVEYSATIGHEFTSPVATTVSDGAVTYSSSDDAIATVDAETGEVTLVANGTVTITASVAETETYRAGSASYELTVIDPNVANEIWSWDKATTGSIAPFTSILVGDNTLDPWSYDNRFGLKGSAYKSSKANATEAIIATPVIDMTNYDTLTLNFREAANQYKVGDAMIDIAEFGNYAIVVARVAGEEEWTEVAHATAPAEKFSWSFYDNEEIDLGAYDKKKMQFGFKYISTDTMAGTWEIDYIVVKGKIAAGISDVAVDEDVTPVYYNLQGVRVANPENGLYIEVRGNKSRKVIIR